MNDFKETRRLIRLKRYEQPPRDYHDNFLDEFRERQRGELLRSSSMRLFLERLATFTSDIGKSRWLIGGALAYGVIALLLMVNQQEKGNVVPASDVPGEFTAQGEVSPLLDPRIDLLEYLVPVINKDAEFLFPLDYNQDGLLKGINGVIIGL
jgi:hypothetical protein